MASQLPVDSHGSGSVTHVPGLECYLCTRSVPVLRQAVSPALLLTLRPAAGDQELLSCGRSAAERRFVRPRRPHSGQMMKRRLRALGALAGILISGAPASGQPGAPVPLDTRVRVELTNGAVLKGLVSAVERDTLYLVAGKTESRRAVATTLIRTLKRSAGRDRWRGARRGALITGVISLAAIGLAVYTDTHSRDVMIPSTFFVVPLGVIFTGLGTGIGAVAAPEKWSERLSFGSAAPGPPVHELRVGVRWRF
jgi:hypothetical protein